MEVWKDIKGFEGFYQVSSLGRLKSFKVFKSGYILSNKNSKKGYLSVVLKANKKTRYTRIHRIVAKHFIPNPENKKQVNHKNMDKQDNRVVNLEWVTAKENIAHAIINKPEILKGMNNYNQNVRPKRIIQKSLSGKYLNIYKNAKTASFITGVCSRNILQVASKDEYKPGLTRKQAGGFVWEYQSL